MGTSQTPIRIVLSGGERMALERLSRSHAVSHRKVMRARLVLALAGGSSVSEAAPITDPRVVARILRHIGLPTTAPPKFWMPASRPKGERMRAR